MEEDGETPLTSWKGVDEYRDPVYPTSLSANFADVYTEVARLLIYRVERTVILNEITQDSNNILGEDSNKTFKFHRLERSMEEDVYTFQSVVELEQRNGGPQQK